MLKVFVSHEGDIVNIMKLFDVANFNLSVVGKGHNGNLRCILYFHEFNNYRNGVYNILDRLASYSAHRGVRSWAANEPEVMKPSELL